MNGAISILLQFKLLLKVLVFKQAISFVNCHDPLDMSTLVEIHFERAEIKLVKWKQKFIFCFISIYYVSINRFYIKYFDKSCVDFVDNKNSRIMHKIFVIGCWRLLVNRYTTVKRYESKGLAHHG
jgi:hypothetical protein